MDNLVVIPIYNESKYLDGVIEEVKKHICDKTDILAIDDGSTDETRRILEKISGIKMMKHEKNEGYGKTLIDGFDYAIKSGYKNVITIDCDRQHEPHLIQEFCKHLDGFDIISGSRYLKPSNEKPPRERFEINQKITKIINEITGYGLTDAFCGFKAYRVEKLKCLKLTESNYGMPLQLWIQAFRNGLRVKEIPVGLVYFDHCRNFPGKLREAEWRYKYYLEIIEKEMAYDRCVSDRSSSR